MLTNKVKNIVVVTGGRADFGLLENVCFELNARDDVALRIVATGSHLSERHGFTFSEVASKQFPDVTAIDLVIDDDRPDCINTYISRAIVEFNKFFSQGCVDVVLVLGDRYEIFAAAIAAAIPASRLRTYMVVR